LDVDQLRLVLELGILLDKLSCMLVLSIDTYAH